MPMKYATHLINSPLKIHHTEPTCSSHSSVGPLQSFPDVYESIFFAKKTVQTVSLS